MSIGFPKRGGLLDFVAYSRYTESEQAVAKAWLQQNGTATERSMFEQLEKQVASETASQAQSSVAQSEMRQSVAVAPEKHAQPKKSSKFKFW